MKESKVIVLHRPSNQRKLSSLTPQESVAAMVSQYSAVSASSSSAGGGSFDGGANSLPSVERNDDSAFVEFNYEGRPRKCWCSLKAPRITPWKTDKNPGRRYFGCPNWTWKKKPEVDLVPFCKYFEWFDTKFSARAVTVIRSLRYERDGLKKELDMLYEERKYMLQEVRVANLLGPKKEKEIPEMNKMNTNDMQVQVQSGWERKLLKVAIVVVVVAFVLCIFFFYSLVLKVAIAFAESCYALCMIV